jgi:hypothetical protein
MNARTGMRTRPVFLGLGDGGAVHARGDAALRNASRSKG